MASRRTLAGLLSLALGARAALVSKNGETAAIPNWDLVSSSDTSNDLASLSKPGVDTSSWHHIEESKCTLMGCLISAGVYDADELWFSDNLRRFNWGQFTVPWLYRNEFALGAGDDEGAHFILQTHGISSRADIFLNGEELATKDFQSGAYSGHEYEITDLVAADQNALVIRSYPTDYSKDLALGFVDWNPYPPDNGTGVWRDVTVKRTGPISLGPLSAAVDIDPANVVLRATAKNLEAEEVKYLVEAVITSPDGVETKLSQEASLKSGESRVVEFTHDVDDPRIWWPKTWGDQPLYSAKVTITVGSSPSDVVERTFGLRTVTSEINEFEDIVYYVNGEKFQVIGGGYSADMFLRWDPQRFEHIALYSLDMGLNTIRLEGKNEHPELYEIADRLGVMIMVGWECCDKWEAWEYNDQLPFNSTWVESDYQDANASMWHDAAMLQTHPSVLTFLVGSDFWPDDKATEIYVNALRGSHFQLPIVASASKRGYPEALGPSGMKMEGPYDWVPPNYWHNVDPAEDRYGAAFSFGSELGPGVGTPELSSLKKFLSDEDMQDLWLHPDKGLYHMSTNVSSFYDRSIYNEALWNRLGEPTSLDDYLLKAQIMDYEAVRAEFEGFSARWSEDHPATGLIYWMLNNAWPSLHWNQFSSDLHPAGSYFGTKVGSRLEHVAYDYQNQGLWIINHSLDKSGPRTVDVEIIDLEGTTIESSTLTPETKPNSASNIGKVPGLDKAEGVVFLKLVLKNGDTVLSRNVYWVSPTVDKLDWESSTWYHTPVTEFSKYKSLMSLGPATVKATASSSGHEDGAPGSSSHSVTLENSSKVPAFFIRMNLVDANGENVLPVLWSDNYLTLWPGEKLSVSVSEWEAKGAVVKLDGANVEAIDLEL